MKEFKIVDGEKKFTLKLPTSLKEITGDYLNAVTEHIIIAPYHAIIASVYRAKLPEVISSTKKSRAMAVSIIPLFVKANLNGKVEEGLISMYNKLNIGSRIIIAGIDIERGYQMSTPNNIITLDTIVKIYSDPQNKDNFNSKIMADQTYYYFVDFKMVPITDIKGFYDLDTKFEFENPFVIVEETGEVSN